MDTGKYVVLTEWKGMDFVPFIFPPYITHADFVRHLGATIESVASAGFVRMGWNPKTKANDRIQCYGRAATLGKDSNPDDDKLLNRLFKDPLYDE